MPKIVARGVRVQKVSLVERDKPDNRNKSDEPVPRGYPKQDAPQAESQTGLTAGQ